MITLSAAYASHWRSSFGIRLHAVWNASIRAVIGPSAADASAHAVSWNSATDAVTSWYSVYSLSSSSSSRFVRSSGSNGVGGSPKRSSPARNDSHLCSRWSYSRWNLRRRSTASCGGSPGTIGPSDSNSPRNCATSTTKALTPRTRSRLNEVCISASEVDASFDACSSLRHE